MANEALQHGRLYHIYNRGNNGETIFKRRRDYIFFLQRYANYIPPVAETYAYCLLPNHFHVALRTFTAAEQEIYWHKVRGPLFKLQQPSRAFNNLFISYARSFNRSSGRTGVLFARPFHRKPVETRHYLRTLITYIHHNPQRHGYVRRFQEWPWSSYHGMRQPGAARQPPAAVLALFHGRISFLSAHQSSFQHKRFAPLLLDDWFG